MVALALIVLLVAAVGIVFAVSSRRTDAAQAKFRKEGTPGAVINEAERAWEAQDLDALCALFSRRTLDAIRQVQHMSCQDVFRPWIGALPEFDTGQVESVEIEGDQATVTLERCTFRNGKAGLTKVIHLIRERGRWFIDAPDGMPTSEGTCT